MVKKVFVPWLQWTKAHDNRRRIGADRKRVISDIKSADCQRHAVDSGKLDIEAQRRRILCCLKPIFGAS